MPWFKKAKQPKPVREARQQSVVPEGLWVKCSSCKEIIYSKELERNDRICPKCGFHFRITDLLVGGARPEATRDILDQFEFGCGVFGSQVLTRKPEDEKGQERESDAADRGRE